MTVAERVVVVTGASRDIGRAIGHAVVASGGCAVFVGRKADRLAEAVSGLDAERSAWVAGDVADDDVANHAMAVATDRFGRVDVLVNNAAASPYAGSSFRMPSASADRIWRVNLRAPTVWSAAALEAGLGEGGAIVNILSAGAFVGDPQVSMYNASKAGLAMLTRQWAVELAPAIRVNAVAPGLVRTDMSRGLWADNEPDLAARVPLARLGDPDDIAAAVMFLASPNASWITGQVLVVDGGSSVRPNVM